MAFFSNSRIRQEPGSQAYLKQTLPANTKPVHLSNFRSSALLGSKVVSFLSPKKHANRIGITLAQQKQHLNSQNSIPSQVGLATSLNEYFPQQIQRPRLINSWARVNQPKPNVQEELLEMNVRASQNIIKLSNTETQAIAGMISLKAKTSQQKNKREPIDLICIIDVSSSMTIDNKIGLVKNSLSCLVDLLAPNDRLCLIKFDKNAELVFPFLQINFANKPRIAKCIEELKTGLGTQIWKGMELAFKTLNDRVKKSSVTGIFLLTDGQDNKTKRTVTKMGPESLKDDTFSIDCFGFGQNYDEEVLGKIARLKDGTSHYIDKQDTIFEEFGQSLGGLVSIALQNIQIKVTHQAQGTPFQQIKIIKAYGPMWSKSSDSENYKVYLQQLLQGGEKNLVFKIVVPPITFNVDDRSRNVTLLKIDLEAQDRTLKKQIHKSMLLSIQLRNPQQNAVIQKDGQVLENYCRVKSAQAIKEAIQYADNGEYQSSIKMLTQIHSQIEQLAEINQEKVSDIKKSLIDNANQLRKGYNNHQRKMMTQTVMVTTEQKATHSMGGSATQKQRMMATEMGLLKSQIN